MFIENFWLFVIVVFSVGGILGFAFFSLRYRNSKRIQKLQEQLDAKTEELESYRGDVNEHFLKTAELVDDLTRSYKAVYDHLEGGAYKLVGEESFRKQLTQRQQLQLEAFSRSTQGENPNVVVEEDVVEEDAVTEDVEEVRAAASTSEPPKRVRVERVEEETVSRG